MRVANENLLVTDNGPAPADMSIAINFRPIWLGHIANFSIQIFFTGSPVGTFKLQMSNDYGFNNSGSPNTPKEVLQTAKITNWTDIVDSPLAVSAAGNVAWNFQNAGFEWVRVVYTPTSGTGTITSAKAKVKGV